MLVHGEASLLARKPAAVHEGVSVDFGRALPLGINVFLNGRAIGHLKWFEYTQVEIPRGVHDLKLVYPDIVVDWVRSEQIRIDKPVVHLVFRAGPLGTTPRFVVADQPYPEVEAWAKDLRRRDRASGR